MWSPWSLTILSPITALASPMTPTARRMPPSSGICTPVRIRHNVHLSAGSGTFARLPPLHPDSSGTERWCHTCLNPRPWPAFGQTSLVAARGKTLLHPWPAAVRAMISRPLGQGASPPCHHRSSEDRSLPARARSAKVRSRDDRRWSLGPERSRPRQAGPYALTALRFFAGALLAPAVFLGGAFLTARAAPV